jgi:hypothetical protein
MANTTFLKNAKMTLMSFDGGKPLDASISKRWTNFSNGFEESHTSKTYIVKAMKNLEEIDLPHEKPNIGALDDVVLGLLYDMLLDITSMHQVNSIDCLRHFF